MSEQTTEAILPPSKMFAIQEDCRPKLIEAEIMSKEDNGKQMLAIAGEYCGLKSPTEIEVYKRLDHADKVLSKLEVSKLDDASIDNYNNFVQQYPIESLHFLSERMSQLPSRNITPRGQYRLYKDNLDWLNESIPEAHATRITYLRNLRNTIQQRKVEDKRPEAEVVATQLMASISAEISLQEGMILSDSAPRRNSASDATLQGMRSPDERQFSSMKSRSNLPKTPRWTPGGFE